MYIQRPRTNRAKLNQKGRIMKAKALLLAAFLSLGVTSLIAAQNPERYCQMLGDLGRGIAMDRERGVSYKAALKKITDAARDTPSFDGIMEIAKVTIQTVYLDMPKITPDGSYKLNYAVCMAAN